MFICNHVNLTYLCYEFITKTKIHFKIRLKLNVFATTTKLKTKSSFVNITKTKLRKTRLLELN